MGDYNLFVAGLVIGIFAVFVTIFWSNDKQNDILRYSAISLWTIDMIVMLMLLVQLLPQS